MLLTFAALGLAPVRARADGRSRIDRLEIDKSERRLRAYAGDRLAATYRVAVGSGGLGPKRFEGDRRTPEGAYRIDRRHRSRQYHRFLHVSYPNAEDRRRFRALRRSGEVPEGRGIGSAIGIHGGNRGARRLVDWTAGCIALRDDEAEALFAAVVPNARVIIRP